MEEEPPAGTGKRYIEGAIFLRCVVYMGDASERAALMKKLRNWKELSCSTLSVTAEGEDNPEAPAILFWDLDGELPPPALPAGQEYALFVCSTDRQKAIDSYALHPAGFLQKPVGMETLWKAMTRCAHLWWPTLERLEVLSDRVRMQVPFYNLIWAEGTRRGCLLHTTCQSIATREPLYRLEQRLPEGVFVRCQRSFIVNLCHVRRMTGSSLYLPDGSELSLGRGSKSDMLSAYRRFCLLRYGDERRDR